MLKVFAINSPSRFCYNITKGLVAVNWVTHSVHPLLSSLSPLTLRKAIVPLPSLCLSHPLSGGISFSWACSPSLTLANLCSGFHFLILPYLRGPSSLHNMPGVAKYLSLFERDRDKKLRERQRERSYAFHIKTSTHKEFPLYKFTILFIAFIHHPLAPIGCLKAAYKGINKYN